jgi:hypothetical protein
MTLPQSRKNFHICIIIAIVPDNINLALTIHDANLLSLDM